MVGTLASSCARCAFQGRLPVSASVVASTSSSSHTTLSTSARRAAASSAAWDLAALRSSLPASSSPSAAARTFTSSAPSLESRRKRQARLKRKSNLERRELTSRLLAASKPDPVLGHMTGSAAAAHARAPSVVSQNANAEAIAAGLAPTTGGEEVWTQSELAKLILTPDEVWGVREDRRGELVPIDPAEFAQARGNGSQDGSAALPGDESLVEDQARFGGPLRLNFGLTTEDRELLFSELPRVMVEDHMLDSQHLRTLQEQGMGSFAAGSNGGKDGGSASAEVIDEDLQKALSSELDELERAEQGSADVLGRVLDLRNASARGIRFENTRRIVQAFGRPLPDGSMDSGLTEVQVALLTYRIRNLYSHLANARHDNHNRRRMNIMVHKRAKLLKYLKRTAPERYQSLLPRVGLLPRAVEGELVLPGKPKVSTM